MPHPDNSNWISLLVGQEVQIPPPQSFDDIHAARAAYDFSALNAELPDVAEFHEEVVLRERQGIELAGELYVPEGTGPFPAMLYMHGGGFCVSSAEGVRRAAMRIAAEGYVVLNLNYGLAPEHPFPWAVEDAVYAARWLKRNAERYRGDPERLLVGGDSSGANLAAVVISTLHGSTQGVDPGDLSETSVRFRGGLFLYGLFDFPMAMLEPGSNAGAAEVWWNLAYLGPNFLRNHRNPLVSPIYADNLDAFPPVYLSCGDEDSLLGQSLAMTKALTQANVPTTLSVVAGADHTFTYVEMKIPEKVTPEFNRIFAWLSDVTHQ
jgi:acetyl esterase